MIRVNNNYFCTFQILPDISALAFLVTVRKDIPILGRTSHLNVSHLFLTKFFQSFMPSNA